MAQVTQEMINAGRALVEQHAQTLYANSQDPATWNWLLTLVYNAMRELEPKPAKTTKKGK